MPREEKIAQLRISIKYMHKVNRSIKMGPISLVIVEMK